MSYNKQYNTRNSVGRYNTPGQFVSAGEQQPPAVFTSAGQRKQGPPAQNQNQIQNQGQGVNLQNIQAMEVEVPKSEPTVANLERTPFWMKNKLLGVKKVSNKERRRRQNANLRRLITPKNALMVLNEMLPNEQLANQFKVEPSASQGGGFNQYYNSQKPAASFCADLTVNGNTYKGYGDNKMSARNVAAEQAIRDLIIQKMNKLRAADGMVEENEEESLPMIQLASFALHKLFSEWEYEGHKVPQLRPLSGSVSEAGSEAGGVPAAAGAGGAPRPPGVPAAPKKKELPANAASMHPCMVLSYMRPLLEYRELAVEGDRPQNMTFTLGIDVDGATYIGKASNKKEARKQAARAACHALWGVKFADTPADTKPAV